MMSRHFYCQQHHIHNHVRSFVKRVQSVLVTQPNALALVAAAAGGGDAVSPLPLLTRSFVRYTCSIHVIWHMCRNSLQKQEPR